MAENDLDAILGGMTKEEFARARRLLPSQYSELSEIEEYDLANREQRVAMLNAIYGSPAAWPEGEVSALAELMISDSAYPYRDLMEVEAVPLTSRIAKIDDCYISQNDDGTHDVSYQRRIVHFNDLEPDDRTLAESIRDSPRNVHVDHRRVLSYGDLFSRDVFLLRHPEMSDEQLREVIDDLKRSPEARSAVECVSYPPDLVPRFSTESIGQLEKAVRYDKLTSSNPLVSRMAIALMKRPEVDAELSLEDYYHHCDWKKTAPLLIDATSARKLLDSLKALNAQGIEVDVDHPIRLNEAIALASMLDDGSLLAKADLSVFEYDMLTPVEENRLPLARSTEVDCSSYEDSDYEYANVIVTEITEITDVTESTLYYLPDTDRYLLENKYGSECTVYKEGEYIDQNPEIEEYVDYDAGDPEEEHFDFDRADEQIVTKEKALEFLNSANATPLNQTPEADAVIDRLRQEVSPDPASGPGCDLDMECGDAREARDAVNDPAERGEHDLGAR